MFGAMHMQLSFKGLLEEVFELLIPNNVANPNLRQLAVDAGWNQSSKVLVKITAALVNTINLTSGMSFPGGLEIYISSSTRVGGVANGGDAIITAIPVTIDNQGTISGGGGSGGSGGYGWVRYSSGSEVWGYNGGGGTGEGFSNINSLSISPAYGGGAPTRGDYTGPTFGGDSSPWIVGGYGGTGGQWGNYGSGGGYASYGGTISATGIVPPSGGSAPGCYVRGNNFVTWKNNGTRAGLVVA